MGKNEDKSFLGTGVAFPIRPNNRGEISLVRGEKDIAQSIWIILGTRLGERVMRPTFGCRVHDLLFEPIDATTSSLMKAYVEEALEFWEPRIKVMRVQTFLDGQNNGAILVEIEYEIKETHDIRSIIYPFFLAGNEVEVI